MSNQFFQFKQFTIHQERCGMKVSTDACIQGAWTPVREKVRDVLDIGTGTGLLSLMLAQRNEGLYIDALELDEAAAVQAAENVKNAPWSERINVVQADARSYTPIALYDMVICNPPFFNNSLLGESDSRNAARHTLSLSYIDLVTALDKVLMPEGYASILLPVAEHEQWEDLLQKNNWYINQRLLIQPKEAGLPNRVVSLCSRNKPEEIIAEKLVIYSGQNEYTPKASKLLRPFYLKL